MSPVRPVSHRALRVFGVFLLWTAIAVLFATQLYFAGLPWSRALDWTLPRWYAWGLVALSAVTLSPAWIWFSGASALSYLKFVVPQSLVPGWVLVLEYVPLLGLLAWEAGRTPAGAPEPAAAPAAGELRPLPASTNRRALLPLYMLGAFPLIAIVIALYFFLTAPSR